MTTIKSRTQTRLLDGYLSMQDALEISDGPLSDRDKRIVLHHLDPGCADPAALQHLGITASEVRDAARGRDDLFDKAKAKLIELVRKEVFKTRKITVTDFKIGNHLGLQVSFNARLLKDNDPLIANDPSRRAMEGTHRVWVSAGYGIYPKLGFGGQLPLGQASVRFGFSAQAFIGVGYLAPFEFPELPAGIDEIDDQGKQALQTTLELVKAASVELPFNSRKAIALERGAEITFRGKGNLTAYTEVAVGKSLGSLGNVLSAGYSVGGGAKVYGNLDLTLRVKKVGHDRHPNLMVVAVSRVDTMGETTHVGAKVGVDSHMKDAILDLGGGILDASWDLASAQMDKQLEKWLRTDLRAVFHVSASERKAITFLLDLDQEAARQAYDDLIKLDLRAAQKLVQAGSGEIADGRPVGGAAQARVEEYVRSRSNSLKGVFGKITLLSMAASETHMEGAFKSTSRGVIRYQRRQLGKHYHGIISKLWQGKRSLLQELTVITENDQPPEYYYYLSFKVENDRWISEEDLRKFLTLGSYLRALENADTLLHNEDFMQSFGKSDTAVELYVTQAGLQKLLDIPEARIREVFAQVYRRMDAPLDGDREWERHDAPWLAKAHPDYQEVMHFLKYGEGKQDGNEFAHNAYRRLTGGRKLFSDRNAYRDMNRIIDLLARAKEPSDGVSPLEAFGAGADVNAFDFWKMLATAAYLIGPEETLVKELSIKDQDHNRDFVLLREGAIQDIRTEIKLALTKGY